MCIVDNFKAFGFISCEHHELPCYRSFCCHIFTHTNKEPVVFRNSAGISSNSIPEYRLFSLQDIGRIWIIQNAVGAHSAPTALKQNGMSKTLHQSFTHPILIPTTGINKPGGVQQWTFWPEDCEMWT